MVTKRTDHIHSSRAKLLDLCNNYNNNNYNNYVYKPCYYYYLLCNNIIYIYTIIHDYAYGTDTVLFSVCTVKSR